jgi:hypothetical protein
MSYEAEKAITIYHLPQEQLECLALSLCQQKERLKEEEVRGYLRIEPKCAKTNGYRFVTMTTDDVKVGVCFPFPGGPHGSLCW